MGRMAHDLAGAFRWRWLQSLAPPPSPTHTHPTATPCLQGGVKGISLTGWSALAGMMALALLIVCGAVYGWRRYTGQDRVGYTLVQKTEQRGAQDEP